MVLIELSFNFYAMFTVAPLHVSTDLYTGQIKRSHTLSLLQVADQEGVPDKDEGFDSNCSFLG